MSNDSFATMFGYDSEVENMPEIEKNEFAEGLVNYKMERL